MFKAVGSGLEGCRGGGDHVPTESILARKRPGKLSRRTEVSRGEQGRAADRGCIL